MKAVKHHTDNKVILLYVERWLKAPLQTENGEITERTKGVPQGSVIGPLLMNLFMHYAFDTWMDRHHSLNPFARYADDGVVHCRSREEAEELKAALLVRFRECGLELHPEKTRIIYCKGRKSKHQETSFDFLGYTFRPRSAKNSKKNSIFVSFLPGVSKLAIKTMCKKTRDSRLRNRTELSLTQIAKEFNPILAGWLNYYGAYYKSGMYPVLRHFNKSLVSWAMRKYKKLKGRKTRAGQWLERIAKENPNLFVHWRRGMVVGFA
jgi:group II intron reverse transcriptase/maturase